MEPRYPRNGSAYMDEDGPADLRFQIPNGKLLHHTKRDARFPYIYEIQTHILVHCPQQIKKILIHVVDSSEEALIACAKYEKTLSVPLGPNSLMENYGQRIQLCYQLTHFRTIISGLFELESGTILFARPLRKDGRYREEDDIVEAWCLNGYDKLQFHIALFFFLTHFRCDFLSDDDIKHLDNVRDLFLGPAEDMTSEKPRTDPNNPGRLVGGTAFERCGQHPVKDSGRCYSLSMTHQRQRALVGPTSGGKFFGHLEDSDDHSLNLQIRSKVTKVSTF